MMRLSLLLLLLLSQLSSQTNPAGSQRERVLRLLDDYDVNVWPDQHRNSATDDFTLDLFLRQRWNDHRLAYEGGLPSYTIVDPQLREKIWKPDTFFENVKVASLHTVTVPNVLLRVSQNGDVLYSMRLTLRLSCSLELELYPFDAQTCYLHLSSYANPGNVIAYSWSAEDALEIDDEIEISEFDLMAYGTENRTVVTVTGIYSGLTAHFALRRQNGYHILQTYIPTILIVFISWVSFWLDPNAAPGRITLGVTTLLTLTTLAAGVRQALPPVSYVKAIDVWIGVCMIMVFSALLEFTVANWLANKLMIDSRLPELIHLPRWLAGYTGGAPKPLPGQPKMEGYGQTYIYYARALDRLSRVVFPVNFLVFNLIYWPYYIILQRAIA
ncbi:glycine receptor subunit alphaZ1 isoform X2 [Hyalella azteca]|uniref:Glycine receptor subunit alphaZ1 isoform X2 n=1 Tax=Hyalella azteca TaxID=294128 RepID=A0A979FMK1_HYAAZ|nr:glycine receptor subunit alphaZ1 isoform X2 [Hyalella azteca]